MINIVATTVLLNILTGLMVISNNDMTLTVNLSSEDTINLDVHLKIDFMANSFGLTVILVTIVTVVFTISYIEEEVNNKEFITLVIMFVVSMFLIISSPNIVSIILGWDGLGITSFILVIFYQNNTSLESSIVTAYSNRIGDLAIITVIATNNESIWTTNNETSIISFIIVTAAITNSAQIPFSAWLPAAIAAPTPVSTLVHSSTLVTAGVWLLNRFSISMSVVWSSNLLILAATSTTLIAGITATNENDLNNIVAISTLSQISMLMISTAMNISNVTMFHINTHALFNAILFISVGSIIEENEGSQKNNVLSINSGHNTIVASNVATINLISLPITLGYFSNDMIMEAIMTSNNLVEVMIFIITATLTISYSNIIINVTTNNNKSASEENGNFNNSTATMIMLVIYATTLTTNIENNISNTSTIEKNLWVVIILLASWNSVDFKENSKMMETIQILSLITSNELSNINKSEKTDKSEINNIVEGINLSLDNLKKSGNNVSINKNVIIFSVLLIMAITNL